jgi:uncharacterized protein YybS (DUF2232 family)
VKPNVQAEWFFLILTSIMLFIAGSFMPILAPAAVITASAPFMVLSLRQGTKRALGGLILGTALVTLLFGAMMSIVYSLSFGVLGLLFAELARRRKSGAEYLISAVAISALSKVLLMAAFVAATGVNPFTVTPESMQPFVSGVAETLAKSGISVSNEAIQSRLELAVANTALMMPSIIVLFSALDSVVAYGISLYASRKMGGFKLPKTPPFALWRFPKNIFWALLASLIVDLIAKAAPDQRLIKIISVNLMEVLRWVFVVEGLAVCWYYMTAKGIKKPLKIVVSFFGVFFSPVSYILSLVGIFDIWYDLRSRMRRK